METSTQVICAGADDLGDEAVAQLRAETAEWENPARVESDRTNALASPTREQWASAAREGPDLIRSEQSLSRADERFVSRNNLFSLVSGPGPSALALAMRPPWPARSVL